MKTTRTIIILAALAMAFGFATQASAQALSGSKHDFSATGALGLGQGLLGAGDNMCSVCHAPHSKAAYYIQDAPLANHTKTDVATGYTLYTAGSSTISATLTAPAGSDVLCLSCHDGSIAIDAYGGGAGTATMSGAALLTKDMQNDHPTSIDYATLSATTDPDFNTQAAVEATNLVLYGGIVRCATCHNVHNPGTEGKFLRMTKATLCQACHTK